MKEVRREAERRNVELLVLPKQLKRRNRTPTTKRDPACDMLKEATRGERATNKQPARLLAARSCFRRN
jgi:hypothetical protein